MAPQHSLDMGVHSETQWQWHHEIVANLAHLTIALVGLGFLVGGAWTPEAVTF